MSNEEWSTTITGTITSDTSDAEQAIVDTLQAAITGPLSDAGVTAATFEGPDLGTVDLIPPAPVDLADAVAALDQAASAGTVNDDGSVTFTADQADALDSAVQEVDAAAAAPAPGQPDASDPDPDGVTTPEPASDDDSDEHGGKTLSADGVRVAL